MMSENLLFNFGLTFIIIHEMDAIRCKEWRIFPGLNLLGDKWGFIIFIVAHIPLLVILFIALNNSLDNSILIYYLEIFFIVHLALHIIYIKNPKNEFKDLISWTFIVGPALFGLLDIVLKAIKV